MRKSTKRNGLLALLGLGAFALWKYRKSSQEEKQVLRNKYGTIKDQFCKLGTDIKEKIQKNINDAK